jgi:adenylate kinase
VPQAEAAYLAAKDLGVAVQVAVHLDVARDELVRRMLARARGADDTQEVIEHRLDVYDEKTVPLLEYYAQRERLVTVNGARPMDEVSWSIMVQIKERQRTRRV